jgi:hypothetical protein
MAVRAPCPIALAPNMASAAAQMNASVSQRLGLDRLASGDAAAALDHLEGSPLIAEGRVAILGLDAVRERLGERWPIKREQVWENVERCIARQLGALVLTARVSEVDYIIAQPQAERYTAHAGCLSVLREILTFFLGEARSTDLRLREVTALGGGSVECHPVDPRTIMLEAAKVQAASTAASPEIVMPQIAAEDASPDRWSPFTAGDGRGLKVSCRIHPVFELREMRLVGHRLESRVSDVRTGVFLDSAAMRVLSPGDRERVDLATIARGVSRLRATDPGSRKPLLMLPAAFTTLGASRGRMALSQALREAKLDAATRIVCEIHELDGAPAARLTEAISLVKPFCYAAVGLVRDDRRSIEAAARVGLGGFALDVGGRAEGDQDLLLRLHAYAAMARAQAKVVMALGLSSPRQLALAKLAGLTHASMRADAAADGATPSGVLSSVL